MHVSQNTIFCKRLNDLQHYRRNYKKLSRFRPFWSIIWGISAVILQSFIENKLIVSANSTVLQSIYPSVIWKYFRYQWSHGRDFLHVCCFGRPSVVRCPSVVCPSWSLLWWYTGTLVPITPNPFTIVMILYLRVVFGHYIVIIYFINFKLLETLCELLCVSLLFPQFLIWNHNQSIRYICVWLACARSMWSDIYIVI